MENAELTSLMVDGLLKMKQERYSKEYVLNKLEKFKDYNYKKMNDNDIFWIITYIMFFNMGKKASMIEKKLPIFKQYLYGYKKLVNLNEKDIIYITGKIGFGLQIKRVIKNADMFNNIILKYGSFNNYLKQVFGINDIYASNDKLLRLYNTFQKFDGYAQTAPWHLITELGFMSLKPDTVIRRILYRIGLLNDINDMNRCIEIGREIARNTGLPIRYIDIVMVKYGQVGESNLLGTKDGICTENNPKCGICGLKNECLYYNKFLHENKKIYFNDNIKNLDIIDHKLNTENTKDSIQTVAKENKTKQFFPKETITQGNLELERYKTINQHNQNLIYYLCNMVNQHNIKFKIKYRSDAIALAFEDNINKNIATIWINRDSINILVLNGNGEIGNKNKKGKRCFNKNHIDEEVINEIYYRYKNF